MADIIPDTEIQFFRNVHIDPDHENTIYFPSESAKDTYFDNIPHIVARKCYYQRERRNYCRVEFPLSDLLNRQYMRFKNSQFEDKWFYAFVDDVEYINNITTEVHYTLDPVMTWMGQFDLDECFIERQHSETDNIGDNIVPETFDVGEKVHNDVNVSGALDQYCYLLVATPTQVFTITGDEFGYFNGLHVIYIGDNQNDVINYINNLAGAEQDAIQGIYYVPKKFVPAVSVQPGPHLTPTHGPISESRALSKPVAGVTTIDGYTPKNNKLYTYPFYNLLVESTEGEYKEFCFERFKPASAYFEIRGIVGEQTEISLIPIGYNMQSTTERNYTEAMTMTNFPMCSWNVDTYKAFLAQQMVTLPSTILRSGAEAILSGNMLPAVATAGETTLDFVTAKLKSNMKPYESRGRNCPQLSLSSGNNLSTFKEFYFFRESIKRELAERLDGYFKMFGYAINDVAKPNMCARPYYTYIKTIGCHVNTVFTGSEDVRFIEECFNNGMRLWNGANLGTTQDAYIGNYSTLDNSPTVTP